MSCDRRAGLAVDAAASCANSLRQGGLLSVSSLGFALTSGAVRFVASYSDGNVHNAVGPCGANGPCVRQNRVVLAASTISDHVEVQKIFFLSAAYDVFADDESIMPNSPGPNRP